MRIAVVTETYPPEINGVALTVQALVHGLVAHGHSVDLIRPRQPQPSPNEADIDELLTRGAALPWYPGLRFGLPARRVIEQHWCKRMPDAVYVATEGPLGLSALRAAKNLGVPASTGFHTRFDDFARHYGLGLLTPVVFAWLRRFHRRAAATLVPTKQLKQFLDGAGFGNVRLLRRAVDTHLFDPSRRDASLRSQWDANGADPVVVYVGRIAPEKNLGLAVRAFRAIQRERPGARYVWVGDGPARAELEAANPDFVFAGMRHGEDLARHYASADLFLFPSLTETFGNVTLEAMASGIATVAYDYGAAREYITDGVDGCRIPRGYADGFVAAAAALARNAALRARLGTAAHATMASSKPEAVITSFVHLLDQLRCENTHANGSALASS